MRIRFLDEDSKFDAMDFFVLKSFVCSGRCIALLSEGRHIVNLGYSQKPPVPPKDHCIEKYDFKSSLGGCHCLLRSPRQGYLSSTEKPSGPIVKTFKRRYIPISTH
jgi:hypothetical protein